MCHFIFNLFKIKSKFIDIVGNCKKIFFLYNLFINNRFIFEWILKNKVVIYFQKKKIKSAAIASKFIRESILIGNKTFQL